MYDIYLYVYDIYQSILQITNIYNMFVYFRVELQINFGYSAETIYKID